MSKYAAYFVASRLYSLVCRTHSRVRVSNNVKQPLNFSRKNQGLKMSLTVNGRTPNTGHERAFHSERLEKNQLRCHVCPATTKGAGAGVTKSRPQKVPSLRSGPLLSARWVEACHLNILDPLPHFERQEECQTPAFLTSLPALKSGGGVSFLWKTTRVDSP